MAHPLANKTSDVAGTINTPVITQPPRISDFVRQFGFKPQALEAFDNANEEWVARMNDSITRTFQALKDQP